MIQELKNYLKILEINIWNQKKVQDAKIEEEQTKSIALIKKKVLEENYKKDKTILLKILKIIKDFHMLY